MHSEVRKPALARSSPDDMIRGGAREPAGPEPRSDLPFKNAPEFEDSFIRDEEYRGKLGSYYGDTAGVR